MSTKAGSPSAEAAAPVVEAESIYTAKRTLKAWLTVLEDGGLLKPGATARILTNRKLKRCATPIDRS